MTEGTEPVGIRGEMAEEKILVDGTGCGVAELRANLDLL